MRLPLQSYDLENPASTSSLVNCYVESLPEDARAPYLLKRAPGTTSIDTTFAKIRRLLFFEAVQRIALIYDFNGISATSSTSIQVRKIDQGDTTTGSIGSFVSTAMNLDIDQNADTLVIVADGTGWTTTGSTVSQITDTDFTSRTAGDVEFLDNFLLFREPDSGRFFGADIGSATAYDALAFSTAEAGPDRLIGMKSDQAQLILFGRNTTEIWDSTGGRGFPFRRVINGSIEKGCINGRTVARIDNSIIWVADDKTVRVLDGLTPVRISNYGIEKKIAADPLLHVSTEAFTYNFGGHNFYVLKGEDYCVVYDLNTGQWHERKSNGLDTWRFGCAESAWGNTYLGMDIGTFVTPTAFFQHHFGIMSDTEYTECGDTQIMEWTYQPVWNQGQRVFHDRLEIVMETGVGTSGPIGQGKTPEIMLELSDDGGSTWQAMPNRDIGSAGKKLQRVVWHNLGSSYQRVYRCRISDPVPVTITDTILHAKGGRV